jgi:uncharacterized protein
MRRMKPQGRILFAFTAVILCESLAQAETDYAGIARQALGEVIRPGYSALAETTGALSTKVQALCQQPSSAALKDTKDAFAASVAAWSKVEILRFGPVTQDRRYERYWPDPKWLGLKQVRDAPANKDETVTAAQTLAPKSVALQGLPALEELLYGEGADALAKGGDAAFRCRFAASTAANVDNIAKEVVEGWSDGAPFTKVYLDPTPSDPVYHASKEVTLDLFKAFGSGIELVRDQKLGKPLGAKPEEAKPKLAAFWRSGAHFRQRRRQSRRRPCALRPWRLRSSGGGRIAWGGGLDPIRPRPRHPGLAWDGHADRRNRQG